MESSQKNGIIFVSLSYILWGFLPIYWKLVDQVPAGEILAHRIIWSFLFMAIIVTVTWHWRGFIKECRSIISDRRKLLGISSAALIVSLNWMTFIWAVNNGHVIQASLGYYINPLVSILLGIIFLKETLTRRQLVSVMLAAIGVINLTISYGVFPWISLTLAITFALYGLLKKTVDIPAMFGLTIETLIVTPLALLYLAFLPVQAFDFGSFFSSTNLLLMGAGVATAVPLLLFASGTKTIPLAMVGFLQYIAPTLMLFLGVFLYHEPFSSAHAISFACIWAALILYLASVRKPRKQPAH
ncbi:EamA family transporter RarD [Virgibacillus sp. 179-BFC.A HS]|uniref:EamA family transporter RarD n=1 Tax=Tigheibacillus jepli TaxID=3035914 RepID=A0ABU5CF57_9BACI|nr:EamA family transporter RarD [Virgibacillus sp. 179-BFC.A HS]MDY0404474.1 EamA family transporter RarD [Virgibacillus sp. 179-BFC.A HS]